MCGSWFATHSRLIVDIGRTTATLDGKPYDVGSLQALRWLAVLSKRPGHWISGRELEQLDTELIVSEPIGSKSISPKQSKHLSILKPAAGSRI